MPELRFGIRERLIMIAALAFLPPAAVCVGFAMDLWERVEVQGRADLMAVAVELDDRHDTIVREARDILTVMAGSPQMSGFNPAECAGTLAEFRERYRVAAGGFQNLALFAPNGLLICRAVPAGGSVDLSDIPWFRDLIETGRFSIESYAINRATGRPIMTLAVPVRPRTGGDLAAVLIGSFDLASIAVRGITLQDRHQATTIFTDTGLVLFRQPQAEEFIGRTFADATIVRDTKSLASPRSFRTTGFDGIERFAAVRPLTPDLSIFVAVSLPVEVIDAQALRLAAIAGALLLAAAVLVGGATWFAGDRLIVRPIRALSMGARRLQAGDFSARVRLQAKSELRSLAATFNNMAATLEGRSAELERERIQLADTSMQLRAVIDGAPLAIVNLDPGGNVVLWSPGAEKLFGWSASESLGRPPPYLPVEMLDEFRRNITRVAAGGLIDSREIHARRKDGKPIDTLMSAGPIFRSDGSLQGLLAVFQDITDVKRADAALKEKSAELATIVEAAPLPIFVTDTEGRVTLWNHAAEQVYGWPASEVIGGNLPFVPPDKAHEGQEIVRRLRAGERISAMPAARIRKDGSPVEVLVSAAPTHDTTGRIRNLVSVHQDVTEMKHAERRLHETMSELSALVLAVPVPIVAMDSEDHVTMWNPAAERLFGWQASAVTGRLIPFVPQDKVEEGKALRARIHAGEVIVGQPVVRRREDGTLLNLLLSGGPIFAADGLVRGIMISYLNVTEQNKVAAQLRQAQRMEVVGQLTGGLAHDFNNLLGIIIGNLDLLKDELGAGHSSADLVTDAINACQRGAQLNKSLLAFSRQQDLAPQRVDLKVTLQNTANLMRRTLGERVELTLHIDNDLRPIRVDPAQLESAILNLSVNARDAMPDGGRLTIEVGNKVLDDSYVAQNPEVTVGDYVMLAVSDTGTGMSPETLARVFEPFFTTKEVGKGSGLGLSMVFGFMRQSGGHIKIYSEIGKGTAVRLYFPADPVVELVDAPKRTEAAAEERGKITGTVLIAEDNESLRRVAVRELGQIGFKVVEAENAQSALALLDGGLRPDLLFTDVIMPGPLDGVGLADEAVRRYPGLRVLLTSGFTERATDVGRKRDLRWPLLNKPYRKAELAAAVQRVMSNETAKLEN